MRPPKGARLPRHPDVGRGGAPTCWRLGERRAGDLGCVLLASASRGSAKDARPTPLAGVGLGVGPGALALGLQEHLAVGIEPEVQLGVKLVKVVAHVFRRTCG